MRADRQTPADRQADRRWNDLERAINRLPLKKKLRHTDRRTQGQSLKNPAVYRWHLSLSVRVFPLRLCLSVCLPPSLCLDRSRSVSLCRCPSFCVCLCLPLSLAPSLFVSVCLSVCLLLWHHVTSDVTRVTRHPLAGRKRRVSNDIDLR